MMQSKAAMTVLASLACLADAGAQTPEGIVSGNAAAEIGVRNPGSPRTYGTSTSIAHTTPAYTFLPIASTTSFTATGVNGGIRCLGGSCFFLAPLFLPAGALVSAIELEACDDDPALDVTFSLYRINAPGAGLDVLATGATAGTPGCSFALAVLPAPETIDNLNSSYAIQVGLTADPSTRFFAVRSTYRLQVSPAPAVASFTDVPTGHPYYRFVEALVDARITAGCGGGNYCVDAPITRGEMAVFLSTALGLHFAP